MAEVLGTVSSLVALLETARKLVEYFQAVKDASKEVNKLTSELRHLFDVLQALHAVKLTSTVRSLLESPLDQCLQELRALHDKSSMRTGIRGALDRFKWPLKAREIEKHIDKFERFKGLFTLALVVDNTDLIRKFEPQLTGMFSIIRSLGREQELRTKDENLRRSEEKREKVLKWLSTENFDRKHREICRRRVAGTGKWIVQDPKLLKWISNKERGRLLWGKGDPGVGKTFLCSVVIDHLQTLSRTQNYGVAYFYFTYDSQDEQKLNDVLASLATQLIVQKSHLPQDVKLWYDQLEDSKKRTRPTREMLESIIYDTSKAFSRVFLVFDALDEYLEEERPEFLSFLEGMESRGISFFVISRPHLEDLNEALVNAKMLQMSTHPEDFKLYIEKTMSANKRAKHLFQDRRRKERVVSVLTKCANGMFQLVYLLLGELCVQRRVSDIDNALDELENSTGHRTYAAIYDKTIQRLQDQPRPDTELAMVILVWLSKARRPLTIDELRIAVSVKPNIHALSENDLPPRNSLVDVCGGLVTVDKTTHVVRLIHSTVQEYILRRPDLILQDMDFLILETCTTYLSLDFFKQSPCTSYAAWDTRVKLHPFFAYAARHWQSLVSSCREELSTDTIHKFLRSPEAVYSFLHATFWMNLSKFPERDAGRRPLHVACTIGHCAVIQRLLERGESLRVKDDLGMTPLHVSVETQHEAIVRLLLENGAAVSARDGEGRTPLYLAIQARNEKVAEVLLDFGADVSAKTKGRWTPLHEAASITHGWEGTTRKLLEKGAAVSAQDGEGRTPLHLAIQTMNEKVAEVLLTFGADVSAQTKSGWTPLHEAALQKYISRKITRQLLDSAKTTSRQDKLGRTPLHVAVKAQNDEVVDLLLQFGADLSARDTEGKTPLDVAVSGYNKPATQLLLKKPGAKIPAKYSRLSLEADDDWSDTGTVGG